LFCLPRDTMETYRIFISSPGDAQFERQRVDRVVARLNGELAGAARLVSVRWETEFYRAHDTFQKQIPASADCEVVVAIFRGRLGTALPPDFEPMPDGAPYPSGTAYEVLTAIAKRQKGGELPDVFVFRYPDPPLVRLDDAAKEEETRRQWEGLKAFFARWFQTPDGHFKAAFQTFTSTDDFEAQLERLLRDWLQHKLAKGGVVTWPIATKGSPYPGLQSFGPVYAPVFFGRARDTARAVEAWTEAGTRGMPFLLVVGASGSGKSSLARAGLVPRLTTPGVVETVDAWRVTALRPSDSPDGPLAALAHALMQAAADLPKDEAGRLPALPEIAEGDYRTPAELAALLAHGDAASIKPILGALDKVAQQEQRAHSSEQRLRCDLVILIDQLDELFAASVSPEERARFAVTLEQLLASGRVWIVSTLRADLYELFLKDETLFRLKDKGVAYDLAPPALGDMAEVVRGPARAANLKWELDPTTKEPLDERIIRDIDRPDLLPILQFVLDRLYQQRATQNDGIVLTNAAYHALGTLNGAIETAAEAALASLGPAAAAALPRLLRSLVVYAGPTAGARAATPALRQAPLEAVAHDESSRQLVRTLIDARILVSGGDHAGVAVVGLAHQRVIEAWARAKEIIAESAELLRVREDVEEARRRWDASGKRSDLLIRAGLPLSEAEHAAAALRDELPTATRAFVEKSGRSARLRQRLTAAAALVFLCLAVAAGFLGFVAQTQKLKAQQAAEEAQKQRAQAENARGQAETQRQEAESARKLAEQQRQQAEAARQLTDLQRQQAELRLAAADELLDGNNKIEELRQCLASTARTASRPPPLASRDFFVGRWHVDQGGGSSDVDWRDDGTCETRNIFAGGKHPLDLQADVCTWQFEKVADDAFVINYTSTKLGDNFPKRLSFKIINPVRIHNVDLGYDAFRIVCPAQELQGRQNELADRQKLADSDVGNLDHQRGLATSHIVVGDVLAAQGEHKSALEHYIGGAEIRKRLTISDPGNRAWQRDLSIGYDRIGQAHQILNQNAEALEAYKSSLAVRHKLYLANRRDFTGQHDLADSLERVAALLKTLGHGSVALEAYKQSLSLRQGLADANRDNAQLQSELAVSLYLTSTVSDAPAAKDTLTKALAVLEALERDHKLTPAQADWPRFVRGEIAKLP
jgi:tetratricopeptide (TPR) repeat protein